MLSEMIITKLKRWMRENRQTLAAVLCVSVLMSMSGMESLVALGAGTLYDENYDPVIRDLDAEEDFLEDIATATSARALTATAGVWLLASGSVATASGALDVKMNTYMKEFALTNHPEDDEYRTDETFTGLGYINNSWKNYVNKIWQYRAMGDYEGEAPTEGGFQWASGLSVEPWSGMRATNSDAGVLPENNAFRIPEVVDGYYEVYSGEQLLWVLTKERWRSSGPYDHSEVKVRLKRDIDLNGKEMNWPIVSLYWGGRNHILRLDGNGCTIYNLGAYHYGNTGTKNYAADMTAQLGSSLTGLTLSPDGITDNLSVAFVCGTSGYEVNNVTFANAKLVSAKKGQGGVLEDNDTGMGIFGKIDSPGLATSTLTKTHVVDSLFFSDMERSYVSPFGNLQAVLANKSATAAIKMENCSARGNFVYGGDHAAGFSTAVSAVSPARSTIEDCFVSDTLIATYGGHSGGFISCYAKGVDVSRCFADIDMYATAYSGGFAGLSAGKFTDCFSTGKLECFSASGGFIAGRENSGVYGEGEIERCYSTTLVGMRSVSQNVAGFFAPQKEALNSTDISTYTFKDCYAAGEVGDTNNSVDYPQKESTTQPQGNGGFFSLVDATKTRGDKHQITSATNCYYDKQTTAMRGWLSSDYNVRMDDAGVSSHIQAIAAGTAGVMTGNVVDASGTIKQAGLTAMVREIDVSATRSDAFKGFSDNSKWEFSASEDDRRYPQLKVFSQADASDGWDNDLWRIVRAYSLASTATVQLDNWGYGYEWNDTGVRTQDTVPYWTREPKPGENHRADQYTYDTVREIISNFQKTSGSDFNNLIIHDDGSTGAYVADQYDNIIYETDEFGTTAPVKAISIYNGTGDPSLNHRGIIGYSGVDWFGIENSVEGASEKASRPMRLVSLFRVQGGDMKTVQPADTYNHRQDVALHMVYSIPKDQIIGLSNGEFWSQVREGHYPNDPATATMSNGYYKVTTDEMEHEDIAVSEGAWLNTEIWTVKSHFILDGTNPNDDLTSYPLPGSGYKWVQDSVGKPDSDPNIESGETVYDERIWYAYNPTTGKYFEERSIKVTGRGTDDLNNPTVDQEKWNGIIDLYPDTICARRYNISYFWLLGDGRYVTDTKSVRTIPGAYKAEISVKNLEDNLPNDRSLILSASADRTHTVSSAGTADGLNKNYESEPVYRWTVDGAGNFVTAATANADVDNLHYTDNVTFAWRKEKTYTKIKKAELTFRSHSGISGGYGTIPLDTADDGYDIKTGSFTVQLPFYMTTTGGPDIYTDFEQSGSRVEVVSEETWSQNLEVTYTIEECTDSEGTFYQLRINKMANLDQMPDQIVDAGTSDGVPDKDMAGDDNRVYIDDISYNTSLTLYTSDFDLNVEKKVSGNYTGTPSDADKLFNFMVIINVPNPGSNAIMQAQIVDAITGVAVPSPLTHVKIDGSPNTIQLKHNWRLEVPGIPTGSTYTVTEILDDPNLYETAYEVVKEDLVHPGLSSGVSYGETVRPMEAAAPVPHQERTITFTNHYRTYDLTVQKKVELVSSVTATPGSALAAFDFYITLDMPATSVAELIPYKIYSAAGVEIPGRGGNMTASPSTANHIQLYNGEYVVLEGLPLYSKYVVRENAVAGYIPTIQRDGVTVSTGSLEYEPDALVTSTDPVELLFTNQYFKDFNLRVKKEVVGTPSNAGEEFTFRLCIHEKGAVAGETTDYYIYDYLLATRTNAGTVPVDGALKDIPLKANQEIQIDELKDHSTYTVTELKEENYNTTAYADGSAGSVGGADGDGNYTYGEDPISLSGVAAVRNLRFVNEYKTFDLDIAKEVVGTPVGANDEFQFKVKLDVKGEGDGVPVSYRIVDSTSGVQLAAGSVPNRSKETLSLKKNQTIRISALPVGTDYEIEEIADSEYTTAITFTAADMTGTPVQVSGQSCKGTGVKVNPVANHGAVEITYTNTYRPTFELRLEKQVMSGPLATYPTFRFEVFLKNTGLATSQVLPYELYATDTGSVIPGTGGTVSISSAGVQNEIFLQYGQQIRIAGIPENTRYDVRELGSEDYDTKIYLDGTEKISQSASNPAYGEDVALTSSGVVKNLRFENSYKLFDFRLTKKVSGRIIDLNRQFTFEVTFQLPGTVTTVPYRVIDSAGTVIASGSFNDNQAETILLRNEEQLQVDNLPVHTGYSVSETAESNYRTSIGRNGIQVVPSGTFYSQSDGGREDINLIFFNQYVSGGSSGGGSGGGSSSSSGGSSGSSTTGPGVTPAGQSGTEDNPHQVDGIDGLFPEDSLWDKIQGILPKTGEAQRRAAWGGILLASFTGLMAALMFKRKKKEKKNL